MSLPNRARGPGSGSFVTELDPCSGVAAGNPPLSSAKEELMGAGTSDKAKGKVDELKGKAKDKVGDLTDDERLEVEGKKDRLKGQGKQARGTLKNAGEDVKEDVKDAVDR